MKNSTLILGAFAAVFAAASIYLGVQLGETREQLAEVEQARFADQLRIRQLEAEYQGWDSVYPAGDELPPEPPASVASSTTTARAIERVIAEPAVPPPPGAPAGAERRGRVADSPAAQNNRRLQQEIRLRRRLAEMPQALGLDATQADKLYDLLADYEIKEYQSTRAYQGDRIGQESMRDATRAQRDADIEALLGPDKAAEFKSFESSLPARMEVNRMGEAMAAANLPLTDAQRASLIEAVASEQSVKPRPERTVEGRYDPEYDAKFLAWQLDYTSRVQARVAPLLTSEQAKQYREMIEVQNARRADALERAKARAQRGDRR